MVVVVVHVAVVVLVVFVVWQSCCRADRPLRVVNAAMGADGVVNGSAKLPITQTLLVKECVLLLRPNVPVKCANFSRGERRPLGPIALTR